MDDVAADLAAPSHLFQYRLPYLESREKKKIPRYFLQRSID